MSLNKQAFSRYKILDSCLSNPYRKYTLSDLQERVWDDTKEIYPSRRTIQYDLQFLDEYNEIEVYERKFYRYRDPDASLFNSTLLPNEITTLHDAMLTIKQFSLFKDLNGIQEIVGKLEDRVNSISAPSQKVIFLEGNEQLLGIEHITTLYDAIRKKTVMDIKYHAFSSKNVSEFHLSPYVLKEHRNRWFVLGRTDSENYIKVLALDRIQALNENTDAVFIEDPSFDPEKYFKDIIGTTRFPGDKHQVTHFVFIADQYTAPYIETKPLHASQQVQKRHEDGSVTFSIDVFPNFELDKAFFDYLQGIRVISPDWYVEKLRKIITRAAAQYQCSSK
ncbi:MAG: WYL domain-containing protein [Bacteroidales bacterium]|nr:WYL domain-containing protein [Bacteroidales bacterium]